MIKKKPAYPFETIAVAVAFSPRTEAILCETKRIAELFSSRLILIHAGTPSPGKKEELESLLVKHGLNKLHPEIIWKEGDPVETILKTCKENVVDLLIAGAMEKESRLKYYIGSISREICRKAKCSVLMFTEPSVAGTHFRKIVVNGADHKKTPHTIGASAYIAEHEKPDEIFVVKELHMPALSMAIAGDCTEAEREKIMSGITDEENRKLNTVISSVARPGVNIHVRSIFGKPGYAISHFAQRVNADLLVINSPDTHLGLLDRIFTHDMEYILENIPCNLLIIHSRV